MPQDYIIKQQPEDFIVREISDVRLAEKGEFLIFSLKKINYNTESAVQRIAESLHISRKSIGYAGSKDSKAVTEQLISIRGAAKERIERLDIKDIHLSFIGFSDQQICLGNLAGNGFEIIVRNITGKPKTIKQIINYFGEQRFSTNNAEIGKIILKKEFKKAAELMLEHTGREEKNMRAYLAEHKNDYVGALKTIPWKNLQLYIHAYQSKLWNEAAKRLSLITREGCVDTLMLPLVGFATELKDDTAGKLINDIMKEEDIKQQDFVIRAIPDLTSAGSERPLYADIKELSIGEPEDDELNPSKKKVMLRFKLGKGSYATEAVKAMLS